MSNYYNYVCRIISDAAYYRDINLRSGQSLSEQLAYQAVSVMFGELVNIATLTKTDVSYSVIHDEDGTTHLVFGDVADYMSRTPAACIDADADENDFPYFGISNASEYTSYMGMLKLQPLYDKYHR